MKYLNFVALTISLGSLSLLTSCGQLVDRDGSRRDPQRNVIENNATASSQNNSTNVDAISVTLEGSDEQNTGEGTHQIEYCLQSLPTRCIQISGKASSPLSAADQQVLASIGLENCTGTIGKISCAKNKKENPNLAYDIVYTHIYRSADGTAVSKEDRGVIKAQWIDAFDNSGIDKAANPNSPLPAARCIQRSQQNPCWNSKSEAQGILFGSKNDTGGKDDFVVVQILQLQFSNVVMTSNEKVKLYGINPALIAKEFTTSSTFQNAGVTFRSSNDLGYARHGHYVDTSKHSLRRLKSVRFQYVNGPGKGSVVDLLFTTIRGR